METWLLLTIVGAALVIASELIRILVGRSITVLVNLFGGYLLLFMAWENCPWRNEHPVISFIAYLVIVLVVMQMSVWLHWSIKMHSRP